MTWMTNYDMQYLNLYGMHYMQRKKPNAYEQEKFKTKEQESFVSLIRQPNDIDLRVHYQWHFPWVALNKSHWPLELATPFVTTYALVDDLPAVMCYSRGKL